MILNKHWNLLIPIVPLWERGARDICLVENGEGKRGGLPPSIIPFPRLILLTVALEPCDPASLYKQ